MSKQVLISMLKQGSTGSETLSILEAITSDTIETEETQPTLEEIAF
jgi:hypothetical protein